MILNIAHRGGAGLAPENTITCFKKGIKYADMLEFDIQPSSDKYLMIFHDRHSIERTTNGKGKVPDLTIDYLKSLDAGSWFHHNFKNERIPTLSEVLESTTSKSILYNMELKYYNPKHDWFENKVIEIIKQFKFEKRAVITARYPENIIRIQEMDLNIDCALLQKERTKSEYLELLLDLNCTTAQIRATALDQDFISKCHDNGIRVFFFYADDHSTMRKAAGLGVDGILTNYPDRLKEFLTKDF
ncbi:MAG: glycerophosphodiester phosphodiesterase [Candidatus Hodarchaeota archaeon]